MVAVERRDGDRARIAFDECLTASRALGNLRGIGFALLGLAAVARLRGDHAMAAAHVRECLPAWCRPGQRLGASPSPWRNWRRSPPRAAKGSGRHAWPARRRRCARPPGRRCCPWSRSVQEAALAPARAALGEAAFAAAWAAGRDPCRWTRCLAQALAWAADPTLPPRTDCETPATQGRLTPREVEVSVPCRQGATPTGRSRRRSP